MLKFLDKLFYKRSGELDEFAGSLVQVAYTGAVSAFGPWSARYPFLDTVSAERWDLVVAVAGVFVGVEALRDVQIDASQREKMLQVIDDSLQSLNKDSKALYAECKSSSEKHIRSFEKEGNDPKYHLSDAVGLWIVWKLLERTPKSDDEFEFVRASGLMLSQKFSDWWKK
jgi:hypothetical protein